MRTTATALLVLLGMASTAVAQRKQPTQEQLRENLAAKKENVFLKNAAWNFDFEKVKEVAQKEDKRIFAYFTRSYAP